MTFDLSKLTELAKLQAKILFFRASREDFLGLGKAAFLFGLAGVWLAGIGRVWDIDDAPWILKSGLLSVGYVFVLTTFLYLFIAPLRPQNWHWTKLLCFISMTGIIGTIYAIPLEMMLPPDDAALGNTFFLFLVASWRVALLGYYLFKVTKLPWINSLVSLVLPLTVIVNVLIWNEQFEKTFAIMGGYRYYVLVDPEAAQNEEARLTAEAKEGKPITYPPMREYNWAQPVPGAKKGVVRGWDLHVGSRKEEEEARPGYREIKWDDPEYIPPGPMMAIIRPLGNFCQRAAPILFLYYFFAVVFGTMRRPSKESDAPL